MRDSMMFILGIAMALSAAAMMVWSEVDSTTLTLLAILGVIFIGVGSRRRREHGGS